MRFLLFYIILVVSFWGVACKKEVSQVSKVPKITFLTINQETFVSFKDSVIIRFAYEDGDGDLGYEPADSLSFFVKDQRLLKPDAYYIPPLAPIGKSIAISGNLRLVLPPLFLLSHPDVETTQLEMHIRDRAGNISNTISSPLIKIIK